MKCLGATAWNAQPEQQEDTWESLFTNETHHQRKQKSETDSVYTVQFLLWFSAGSTAARSIFQLLE